MSQYVWAMIGKGIYYFLDMMELALLLRAILSWFVDPFNRFMQVMIAITEPIVSPVRNLLSRLTNGPMMIDFSPMLTMLLIVFLQQVVLKVFL